MSRQVSRGSAGEYQADERAGVAVSAGEYQADEERRTETEYFCITKQDLETKKEDSSTQKSCMKNCLTSRRKSPCLL